jgi:hypothetical protein
LQKVQAKADELEQLRKDASDVVRLRGQVAQLTRQCEADKKQLAQLKSSPATAPKKSGISFTREQMVNAGYATPEAALQTLVWATMSGNLTPEQIREALSPELLNDQAAYSVFEGNRKESLAVFKSVDMLAKKTLGEDKVEFKAALNVDLGPNAPTQPPAVMVLPMVKVGNQWKLAGNPKELKDDWNDGTVQTFGQ